MMTLGGGINLGEDGMCVCISYVCVYASLHVCMYAVICLFVFSLIPVPMIQEKLFLT